MTDRLLQSLGQVAREETTDSDLDDRWAAWCSGRLSAAEEAALRSEAQASEAGRRTLEAFEPLGPEFQKRMVHQLRRQAEIQSAETGTTAAERSVASESEAQDDPEDSLTREAEPEGRSAVTRWWPWSTRQRPTRRRSIKQRPARYWPTAALATAAVLLILIWPSADLSPLPGYETTLSGGAATSRTTERPSESRFVTGSPFQLVLRPKTAVTGPIVVRAFRGQGQAFEAWDVPAQISKQGSVLITGTLGEALSWSPGRHVLSIWIGRRDQLAQATLAREIPPEDLETRQNRDWVLVRLAIIVAEAP